MSRIVTCEFTVGHSYVIKNTYYSARAFLQKIRTKLKLGVLLRDFMLFREENLWLAFSWHSPLKYMLPLLIFPWWQVRAGWAGTCARISNMADIWLPSGREYVQFNPFITWKAENSLSDFCVMHEIFLEKTMVNISTAFLVEHALLVSIFKIHRWQTYCTVPEVIDLFFAKTSPKRSFSMTENERFGLVFANTGSISSGTALCIVFEHQRLFLYKVQKGLYCKSICIQFNCDTVTSAFSTCISVIF